MARKGFFLIKKKSETIEFFVFRRRRKKLQIKDTDGIFFPWMEKVVLNECLIYMPKGRDVVLEDGKSKASIIEGAGVQGLRLSGSLPARPWLTRHWMN